MRKVKLSDFFRDDFLKTITCHKDRIQCILQEYDVVIFMARKAICFFDALVYNEEIKETKCHVVSSRVIDYDGLDRFQGKKIAVVDDVVVKGTSITRVAEKLSSCDVTADYYVIACEEKFSKEFSKPDISLKSSYTHLTQSDIYKFSGLITQYIEASMRTFNVDSPIYNISDDKHVIDRLLCANGSIDLTSGLQKEYGILNQDIYFNSSSLDEENLVIGIIKKSTIKIRFYSKDGKIIAVPFVLLPQCSIELLDQLYETIRNEFIDYLINCDEDCIKNENKYKTVSYIMEMALFCSFAEKYKIQYKANEYYDGIQFDVPIGEGINNRQFDYLCAIFGQLEISNVVFSQMEFSYYIKAAYEYIASIEPTTQQYRNWKGELIGQLADSHGAADKKDNSGIVFSFSDLYEGISIQTIYPETKHAYVSSVIDVFIDKGFIVPSIVHIENNQILRAYKMGEYSKLTREQLYSFIRMIYLYQKKLNRYLDRTEFEKLCVLFFRRQINNHCFGETTEYDEGCYSVGYSYYGPRITDSQETYTVLHDSAFVTNLVDRGYVGRKKGKYYICFEPSLNDFVLDLQCNNFVFDYSELFNIFHAHPYSKDDNPWNQFIHTYAQYLTILAIGMNPKNQILSLCAEIYQVLCLKEEMFFEKTRSDPSYCRCLSGIDSGLWKYKCFKEDALRKTTEIIAKYNNNVVRGIMDIHTAYDRGEKVFELRDKMGEFLFKAAYVINELLKKNKRLNDLRFRFLDGSMGLFIDQGSEIKTIFNVANFYYKKDEHKKRIDADIEKNIEQYGLPNTIKHYFKRLSREARYLLDICDLYIKTNNANYKPVVEFVIVHSNSGQLPCYFDKSKECVIENLSKPTKTAVFSIHYEQDRDSVMDNVICDTQDVEDCYYLLVSSFQNEYEGYVQYDEKCRGTYVAQNMKTVINMINELPDKKRRLFVMHGVADSIEFKSFKKTRVERIEESIYKSSTYVLDKYNMEREKTMENMENKNGVTNVTNVNISGIGNAYAPDNSGTIINAPTIGGKIDNDFIKQIESAIDHINQSDELDDEQKKQLESIMNDAKNAENEQSEEKRNLAKTAFGYVKSFLMKGAPKLIKTLADLAKIAQFFGIGGGK